MYFMNDVDVDLSRYESPSRRIGVMSEAWVGSSMFCPSCGGELNPTKNNREACDFLCSDCTEEFELKSTSQKISKKILNGAYATLMDRVASQNNPNLYVLQYDKSNYAVKNFLVVPNYFFTQSIIERRNPLAATARRAGYVGSYILIGQVPNIGRIHYIVDGEMQSRKKVLSSWKQTKFLKNGFDDSRKSWLLDTMKCVDLIGKDKFSLDEIYAFEEKLKSKHPDNNHIKDKLRQQLQILRDKGVIEFISRGRYRVIPAS